ncbi:MAG: SRPBCC family protein [Actinobacteria bacterium]|jgi:ribosome-associated toxin RatA of RatAB toxin-antitoxin module|nr:SRPBCC family protein [Actinomycetota bacterium]MCL6094721.1 SRPBCC family protein [Actinomycetota bacterium]
MTVAERATEKIVVAAAPEICYAVAADFERYGEWASDIKEVRILSHDEQGRPQRVHYRAAAFGRSITYTLSYDYSEAPKALSWVQIEGDLTSKLDGRYSFEPTTEGDTEVSYNLEVELKLPIPGFVKRRAEARVISTALRALKARAESQARA